MSDFEIDMLEKNGCQIEYDPKFFEDEGEYDCQYAISYKGIYVGSDLTSYKFVREQMDKIDGVFEDGMEYGVRMA